jgi:hypothetical protein
MANAVRSVADTYLRYAIEIAFLAEQAYEFESDKRLDVIRFDYDLSEVGAMLAADFLMRDLDTLENDLVVSNRVRQQQVRYVVSMAREFPETLRELSDTGGVGFSLRLEQLERHFPGLLNLRIQSLDVQPVALMDPARVSVALTHQGSGMVRLKAHPGASQLNVSDLPATDDWLGEAAPDWPAKIRLSRPETEIFSGLARQDASAPNQRAAFEGLPGASNWRLDLSSRENSIVPGSLTDVLLTFVLSGYFDPDLKNVLAGIAPVRTATTAYISARRALPDAFHSFARYGRADWNVSSDLISIAGEPRELRNVSVVIPLAAGGPELGRSYCRYGLRIEVAENTVTLRSAPPDLTFATNALKVRCAL